jgi:hypothetical protein
MASDKNMSVVLTLIALGSSRRCRQKEPPPLLTRAACHYTADGAIPCRQQELASALAALHPLYLAQLHESTVA